MLFRHSIIAFLGLRVVLEHPEPPHHHWWPYINSIYLAAYSTETLIQHIHCQITVITHIKIKDFHSSDTESATRAFVSAKQKSLVAN